MTHIHAGAIAQVEPPQVGIHLMWLGPPTFLYAPGGWIIERRRSDRLTYERPTCDDLTAADLATLRVQLERRARLGRITLRHGRWPETSANVACEVLTFELNSPMAPLHGFVEAKRSFIYALRDGKAVAHSAVMTGHASFDLGPVAADRLVIFALGLQALHVCAPADVAWGESTAVAKLQLPLRELMPALHDAAGELHEAHARLLPGEAIDGGRFHDLMDTLRAGLKGLGRRPIDRLVLGRRAPDTEFEETVSIDPIRMLYADPKWRRVLGFAYFDHDPSLVPGASYDYRVTGYFPTPDLESPVYGFHTVPSQTALPAEFYLSDVLVRLPEPTVVARAPSVSETGLRVSSRRGIPLRPRSVLPWTGFGIETWSAVIDFPTPVTEVMLELDAGHSLKYQYGDGWGSMSAPAPVPPTPYASLTFAAAATQLRLDGKGFLFALRLAGPAIGPSHGMTPLSMVLPAVQLVDAPRPPPPLTAHALNLQQSAPPPPGSIKPLPLLGFEVRWRPALHAGLPFWPEEEPAPPPLDAAVFQVERRMDPTGNWKPVLKGGNVMLGTRNVGTPDTVVLPGSDLMARFPESPAPRGSGGELSYRDTFSAATDADPTRREIPPLGTFHRYRVRTLDPIGRPSLTWRETGSVRLEKHEPPPLPAAPEEIPADAFTRPGPTGVFARVLVQGAADLTPEEAALLGADANAIVLRWGWHARQRAHDPYARQFRVYLSPPLDSVPGALTSVTPDAVHIGVYSVSITLTRAVQANAAAGLSLNAGYPFYIEAHSAGTTIVATVRTSVPGPGGYRVPQTGPVTLHLKMAPNLTRPSAFSERLAHLAIGASETYEYVVRNRLTLDDAHPRDSLWLGVTSADDQTYIHDTFPGGTLPGNESAVVAVLCQGRFASRPTVTVVPALAPVPRLIAPEPVAGPARFDLDLAPYLAGAGFVPGERVQPERLVADDLVAALDVSGSQLLARVVDRRSPSETDVQISLPNPDDQAAVIAALANARADALDDRYVLYLAAIHPYRDRLFQVATGEPVPFGPFTETFAPRGARYVYRLRRATSVGLLSDEGALVQVIVRVPSLQPPAPPIRETLDATDPVGSVRLGVGPDPAVTHLLTFGLAATAQSGTKGESDVLRVPNRPDLVTTGGIRLRAPDGTLLLPSAMAISDLPVDSAGVRHALVTLAPAPGTVMQLWAVAVSVDGVPSPLAGPWNVVFPPLPLPAPALAVATENGGLRFTWLWTAHRATVALERSADGASWNRISPLLGPATSEWAGSMSAGQYRLRVVAADGRTNFSNVVDV